MNSVKGFRDFVGAEALKRAKILEIIRGQFELYGFEPAETPVVEYEEFVRGDNVGDDAVSDIFKLEDKGERKLALRYELTFPLKRIARNQRLPYKRYQIGAVFRDEPVSASRFRQFTQCDVDVIGSGVKDEVEVLATVMAIAGKLGIDVVIFVNNRRLINEILVGEGIKERYREQVIREIDKLDKLPGAEVAGNLKKFGAEKLLKIFKQDEKFFEKYNFYGEIKELKKLCKSYGIRIEFLPSLARGLSYYNGTVFEARVKEKKDSIVGGGAYLVNGVQSFGYGSGLERWCAFSDIDGDVTDVQIVSLGEDVVSIGLASKLRENGVSVNLVLDKSVGKALEYANAKGVGKVVIVGADEVKKGKFKVKDMGSGDEEFLSEKEILEKFS